MYRSASTGDAMTSPHELTDGVVPLAPNLGTRRQNLTLPSWLAGVCLCAEVVAGLDDGAGAVRPQREMLLVALPEAPGSGSGAGGGAGTLAAWAEGLGRHRRGRLAGVAAVRLLQAGLDRGLAGPGNIAGRSMRVRW